MSGLIHVYTLPQISLVMTFTVHCQPVSVALNMDSTMLSVVDNNGVFSLYHMVREKGVGEGEGEGERGSNRKKEVGSGLREGEGEEGGIGYRLSGGT